MRQTQLRWGRGGLLLGFLALAINCDKDDGGVRGDGDMSGDGDMPGDGDGDGDGDRPGDGDMPGDGDGDMPGDGDGDMRGDGDGDGDGDMRGDGDGGAPAVGGAGGMGGMGGSPCSDEDIDMVCDSADLCPGHDDGLDDDGDSVPDGCDACADDNDSVDLDENDNPDCNEDIGKNSGFDNDVDDWAVTLPAVISHDPMDAQGDESSGSVRVANAGAANFVRGATMTPPQFSAEASSVLVTFGTEYFVPAGQEMGDVSVSFTYYTTGCSGGNAIRVDTEEQINSWNSITGETHIPAGTTCVSIRLEAKRVASPMGVSFDVLFDNALIHMCVDADENFICDG